MAMCELCGTSGLDPKAMFIDVDSSMFIGACCTPKSQKFVPVIVQAQPRPPMQVLHMPARLDDVEYGLELSNKVGVRAYVNYAGLSLQFEKTPAEIKSWATKNGLAAPKTAAK